MNKAKLLKMYMDGEHVKKISQECGCSVKTVYKITAAHGLHRTGHVKAIQPKPKPKPKPVFEEPMYREIPNHISASVVASEHQKKLQAELRAYRETHEKPWYLK